ncbi:MAG: hypothetical protein ACYTFY_23405, partial [Planctomycetota bacterium]
LKWITQLNCKEKDKFEAAVKNAIDIGTSAIYLHGGFSDHLYEDKDEEHLKFCCDVIRSHNIPVGTAGHNPETHRWIDSFDVVDFHAVCFFNCGSVHDDEGEKFRLEDLTASSACIQELKKPCIGYKIMAAGRIDPKMAFEYAYENIKPTDVVNVGMHQGDMENMIEVNADLAAKTMARLG